MADTSNGASVRSRPAAEGPASAAVVFRRLTSFALGAWAPRTVEPYGTATAEIAGELGCLYVDLLEASGQAPWTVHHDGVHQNDLGHRLVANRIFEVLAQHCSCLAKKTKRAERTSPRWRDESTLQSDYGH